MEETDGEKGETSVEVCWQHVGNDMPYRVGAASNGIISCHLTLSRKGVTYSRRALEKDSPVRKSRGILLQACHAMPCHVVSEAVG